VTEGGVALSCSWESEGSLGSSLSVASQGETGSSEMDLFSLETCVRLNPRVDTRCQLSLSAKNPHIQISGCRVVSSFPRWEVVGDHQYIESCQGQRLEELSDEELQVYDLELCLKRSYGSIVLRLPPTAAQSIWLLSLQVTTSNTPGKSPNFPGIGLGNFNLGSVNSLLEGGSMSAKAEQFKTLFDSFQASQAKSEAGINAAFQLREALEKPSNFVSHNQSPAENTPSDLKTYIDHKFDHLEKKLLKEIDDKFKDQNEKLNEILRRLPVDPASD